MDKYIIIPDSTCDLSKELRDYCELKEYICGYFTHDDKNYIEQLDWDQISCEEYYKMVKDKKGVKTAPPSPDQYAEVFEHYVKDGYKIFSMSLSSAISTTVNFAKMGKDIVLEKYPNAEIYIFDSFRMSAAFGLLVVEACKCQKNGMSFEELINHMEECKYKVHQMGPIDDLMYVARRGHISQTKAIMGTFVGIKPMGDCSPIGYVSVLSKVKGIKKALDITVKYLEKTAVDLENQDLIIANSNRKEYAIELKKKIIESGLKPKNIFITDVYYGCGANMGPGMVGVYYFGQKVSENNEKEKAIMDEIIAK